jgi:ribosomal protein S17E
MSIDRYNSISNIGYDFDLPKINTSIPTPSKEDYVAGYITRYFVQKSNDVNAVIYEVSRNFYTKANGNPFYRIVALDWRLSGSLDDIKNSNSASVRIASKTIPKISLYLPNLLQFHKK